MRQRLGPVSALLAVFVLLLAVNVVASLGVRSWKLDLTEEKLYTLSEGSRSLLGNLDDSVTLKLFYSKTAAAGLPRIQQYADRVVELLRQYEAAGNGKLTLEQYDPRPDTEVEEWALRYGLQPAARLGGEGLYFGLSAISEVGREEVIPYLAPERESFLEYDITRLISSVGQAQRKVIGILSSLDVTGAPPNPMMGMMGGSRSWALANELGKLYEVRSVASDVTEIDAAIDLLLVIHPKNLADPTLYAVDQYLLRGGRALVAVDPLSLFEQQTFQNPNPSARFQAQFNSDLDRLFDAWGIELDPGKVVADLDLATQIRMGRQVVRHPAFLSLGPEQCNQEEIVSAEMESLLFAYAGSLRQLDGDASGVVKTTLIHTSARAGTTDEMALRLGGGDPEQLRRGLKLADEPWALALKLSGSFPTAFPDGPPEGAPSGAADTHRAQSAEETTVVVVADVDVFTDDTSVRRQEFFGQTLLMLLNDNLTFAGNVAEVLMGGRELSSLRTRGKSERPFTLVDQLEREADEKWKGVEEELLQKQEETNRRLAELERGKDDADRAVLSQSQVEEVRKFRSELAANKRKLREVRRNLRQDIEDLGARIKLFNIGVLPVLVLLAGFVPLLWRTRRAHRKS